MIRIDTNHSYVATLPNGRKEVIMLKRIDCGNAYLPYKKYVKIPKTNSD